MFFNSLNFALFLPIVFTLYWFGVNKSTRFQNSLLLVASYFFYASWDWRFLFLLLFSTGLDYFSGLKIQNEKSDNKRKSWFWTSIIVNLGFLMVFKYYNFFAHSFSDVLQGFGLKTDIRLLKIILPVGISFYTFHGLSYIIDIYKKRIKAEQNVIDYALFVSYFPLLVAGPIERATHLLPQIKTQRIFNYDKAADGLNQIIWGLFKKIVIADSCAVYVNAIFDKYDTANSLTLLMGALYFSFQIYGDFSGYTDIALGTSKLFGIDLPTNFKYPYFSRDMVEFWRRWHISLSSWFKDYVYIPLGGRNEKRIRNTVIVFLISGFWHGANWTFIAWGFLNALYVLPIIIKKSTRNNLKSMAKGKTLPTINEFFKMGVTFFLVMVAWVIFRAENMTMAFIYLKRLFALDFSGGIEYLAIERYTVELGLLLTGFLILEWTSRKKEHPLTDKFGFAKSTVVIVSIIILGVYSQITDFIYFQF